MSQLLPPYHFILDKLSGSRVIPFLGAGASLGGRLPGATWKKGVKDFSPDGLRTGRLPGRHHRVPRGRNKRADESGPVLQRGRRSRGFERGTAQYLHCDYQMTSLHTFLARIPGRYYCHHQLR